MRHRAPKSARALLILTATLAALAGCGEPEAPRFVPGKGDGPSTGGAAAGRSSGNELNRRNIETH